MHTHVSVAENYVERVISGEIPACKWVKLACKRHVRDIKSAKTKAFPFEFDHEKADRVCRFVSKMPHTKGEWSFFDREKGVWNPIKLEPWQCFVLCSIFGWVKKSNGKRRFRKARVFVPRKNAKTALMAAVGLYMLLYDNEPGAEVYCSATGKQQAMEVFKTSRQMVLKSPALIQAKEITVNVESLQLSDGSIFMPIIGRPKDGSSPHCSITDEYHEHPTSDVLDAQETGMGARSQPISFVISTAGADPTSPCRQEWRQCERILERSGGFNDDSYFAIIFTIDAGDDWDNTAAMIKANPNYGVSIYEEGLAAELNEARNTPKEQSKYKTKKLNLWVSARDAYFNSSRWNDLARPIKREDYKGFPSIIGADFATRRDLTSIIQLFILGGGKYAVFGKHYLPQETIDLPENQHYRTWKIEGRLKTAGEEATDFDGIKADLIELCHEYQVEEIALDPTRMWGMLASLEAEGLPLVRYPQTTVGMSEPMKSLDATIQQGNIIHDGDPILAWCISNVISKPNAKENHFPRKENEVSKIDAAVSLLFAIGRADTREPETAGSFFSF